jgi:DNA-binding NarL/FixJ family response regulator
VTHEAVRVAVLSASACWRDATAALLSNSPGLEYTGAAATIEELGRLARGPDVVVFEAPDDDAVETLLQTGSLAFPLVILTDSLDRDSAVRALRLGGVAILDREPLRGDLLAAVHSALRGLCTLSLTHLAKLTDPAENVNAPLSAEWIEPLTPRELQILRMLSEGLANRAIAAQLEISEHTAKFQVGQILAKLGAESRTGAVTIGIRHGLIMV